MVETSASFEARYAPLSHPTAGGDQRWSSLRDKVEASTRTFGLRRAQQGQIRCSQARVRGNRMTTAESKCMAAVESSRKCLRATHREPGFLKWSHGYGRIGTTGCQCPTLSPFETSQTKCFNGFDPVGTSERRLLLAVDV